MRLRNVKGAREMLEASHYVEDRPEAWKGKWSEKFENDFPIYMEIGMGKGKFITTLARENPEINYIGVEMYSSVLVRAIQRLGEEEIPNLCFLCMDARELPGVFDKAEIDRIYLNFSDPWPKERHSRRRLTSEQFMGCYNQFLAPNGLVEFKTDNRALFEYSLVSIPDAGWRILAHTFDLHHSEMLDGNVMTEYEEKFVGMGMPICKLIADRRYE